MKDETLKEDKKIEKKEKQEKFFHPETGVEISKNEFKKLDKAKKKTDEKVVKDKEKDVKISNEPKKDKPKIGANMEEEVDPTKYLENRKNWLSDLKKNGINPFPHKFDAKLSIPEFVKKYSAITEKGKFLENEITSLAGRIYNIRVQSHGLIFYDLIADDVKLQVYCNAK